MPHYGAPEEKKEPTDKLGQQRSAPSTGTFPRRIDSPPAVAPPPRASPYIPPPIPAAKPPARAQDLEEIEPDEVMAPPADTASRPLRSLCPEAEAESMGLEPIAAHSQPREAIAAEEEVGQGSATDAVEGLVPATTGNVAADEAAWAQLQAAPAQPESAWGSSGAGGCAGLGRDRRRRAGRRCRVGRRARSAAGGGGVRRVARRCHPGGPRARRRGGGETRGSSPLRRGRGIPLRRAGRGGCGHAAALEDDIDAAENPAGAGEAAPAAEEAPPKRWRTRRTHRTPGPPATIPWPRRAPTLPPGVKCLAKSPPTTPPGPMRRRSSPTPSMRGASVGARAEPAAEESPREWGAAEDVPVEEAFETSLRRKRKPALDAAPPEEPRSTSAAEEPRFERGAAGGGPGGRTRCRRRRSRPRSTRPRRDEEGDLVEGWVGPPRSESARRRWIGEARFSPADLIPRRSRRSASIPNDGVGALRLLAASCPRSCARRQID